MAGARHETLVEQASHGDRVAVEALLERHLPNLLAYVRLHAGDMILERESCSDLAQSACREILGEVDRFEYRGEPAFRKWLFTTALNKIRERYRYHHAHKRDIEREVRLDGVSQSVDLGALLPSFQTPTRAALADEDMALLERAFAELSDEHRQVITLSRLIGMPHTEIAEEMKRSAGAVRALLHRALFRLGWLMEQRGEE